MGAGEPAPKNGGMKNAATHIYIVDDSVAIRSRLAEMLGRLDGVRVVGEAAGAGQAVAEILSLRPHSVLLDLNLEGSSGMQVLRAIHSQAPDIVFVVLTNHAEPQYRRACERAGAAYFLDKSTEFDRVPGVIAQIASTRH
jgi:DNA-binding NarL/FixJ family response regulator